MAAKTSGKPKTGAPKYHRLTVEKRSIIWALKREGKSKRKIAGALGVHRSTVYREMARNASRNGYRHQYAQALADGRAAAKAAKRRKFTEATWRWAMARLALGWSFPCIVGRAGLEGVPMVCAETLYKEYYRRQKAVARGELDEVLPPLPRAHRKRRRRGRGAFRGGWTSRRGPRPPKGARSSGISRPTWSTGRPARVTCPRRWSA